MSRLSAGSPGHRICASAQAVLTATCQNSGPALQGCALASVSAGVGNLAVRLGTADVPAELQAFAWSRPGRCLLSLQGVSVSLGQPLASPAQEQVKPAEGKAQAEPQAADQRQHGAPCPLPAGSPSLCCTIQRVDVWAAPYTMSLAAALAQDAAVTALLQQRLHARAAKRVSPAGSSALLGSARAMASGCCCSCAVRLHGQQQTLLQLARKRSAARRCSAALRS